MPVATDTTEDDNVILVYEAADPKPNRRASIPGFDSPNPPADPVPACSGFDPELQLPSSTGRVCNAVLRGDVIDGQDAAIG